MTWNIHRGFHNRDHVLEEHRLAAAKEIINKESPDVLALVEACYAKHNSTNILLDYPRIFGFPNSFAANYPKFGRLSDDIGANCLLSHYPISAARVSIGRKSAIRAQVSLDNKFLHIDVVHPSPSLNDREKIRDLDPMLLARANYNYIMTGDFNSLSYNDIYDKQVLIEEFSSFSSNPNKVVDSLLECRLVRHINDNGLVDSLPLDHRTSTVPTRSKYNKSVPGMRVDYCFVSPDVRVLDSYVVKNELSEVASDHYPLVTILDL